MAWAMLPGLMNLKRMSASGGWNRGSNWWFVASWVRVAIRPAVEAPPTTCCCRGSQGSQISPLTISSRGSGWPASWWSRVPPRIRAPQIQANNRHLAHHAHRLPSTAQDFPGEKYLDRQDTVQPAQRARCRQEPTLHCRAIRHIDMTRIDAAGRRSARTVPAAAEPLGRASSASPAHWPMRARSPSRTLGRRVVRAPAMNGRSSETYLSI